MKEPKRKKWTLVDSLFWLGAGLISVGIGLLAVPVGVIAAGGFCILGAVLIDRGTANTTKGGEGG